MQPKSLHTELHLYRRFVPKIFGSLRIISPYHQKLFFKQSILDERTFAIIAIHLLQLFQSYLIALEIFNCNLYTEIINLRYMHGIHSIVIHLKLCMLLILVYSTKLLNITYDNAYGADNVMH